MKRFYILVFLVFFGFSAERVAGQVTVTSSDSVTCTNHCTVLTAHLIGDLPINSGITIDDIFETTPDPIGFTFQFYGVPYTSCLIGPNGNICFDLTQEGLFTNWEILGPLAGTSTVFNTICAPWCDIDIVYGGTITYSTDGVAPNRKFVVTYCHDAMYNTTDCPGQFTTSQCIMYETSNIVEVHITNKTICAAWNGGHAICGVQNATGTFSTAAPGRDWEPNWSVSDEAWRFTPISSGTSASYVVTSIPYAPIPFDTSTIYWYNATTGAYLGTGPTMAVCTDTRTLYKAGALGCADTSFGYYYINPSGSLLPLTYTSANPSHCGAADGSISLRETGLMAGGSDTFSYYYGGVLQPDIVTTDSDITIPALCAGLYTNFTVTQGDCSSPPVGPIDLTAIPITISSVTPVSPDTCGHNRGSITLHGLYPGIAYTISYDLGGVPQIPVALTSSGAGDVALTKLCAGVYSNIVATYTGCTTCATAPKGPYTLTNPPISTSRVTFTNSFWCPPYNGTISIYGLYPGQAYTITYDSTGVANPAVTLTADDSGKVVLTGLGRDGTIVYSDIIVSYSNCGTCTAPAVGPVTLVAIPPPPIVLAGTQVNPSQCGYCDGIITLRPVTPYSSDTITYSFNGVPQPRFETYADGDSNIVLTGLCGGAYSDINVKIGNCVLAVTGSPTLVTPHINAGFSDVIHYGCHGDTVLFSNESNSPGATNPVIMYYQWNFGDSSSDSAASPTHVYAQGTYTITMTADNHYCFTDTQMVLTLFHPLKAGFTYSPSLLCQNGDVTFTDTSIGALSYQWNFGNGVTANTANAAYNYQNSGVYKPMLVVANNIPCMDTAMAVVEVDSQSDVKLVLSDSVLCRSTDVSFDAIFTSSGNTGMTWNFGDGDSVQNRDPLVRSFDATGIFTVTAIAYFRVCRDTSASKVVHVYPQPGINLGPGDTTICAGSDPMVLTDKINEGNPDASWKWSTGQTGPSITVVAPGIYTSTVTLFGCTSSFSVDVKNDCYIDIPNVFSPNGDGLNDYFFPRTTLTSGLITFNMNIYNRWGELIFQSSSLDGRGWDGTFNNVPQPEGVYVYVIDGTFKDGQKEHHQGNVTLVR